MKVAMGRLGWTPELALHSDPQMILLAYEGYSEDREELERIIFGANGIQLPPLPPRDEEWMEGPAPGLAGKVRAILNAHDKVWRASRKKRRGGVKKTEASNLPPKT